MSDKTFISETPCKRGHTGLRYIINGGCLECIRAKREPHWVMRRKVGAHLTLIATGEACVLKGRSVHPDTGLRFIVSIGDNALYMGHVSEFMRPPSKS